MNDHVYLVVTGSYIRLSELLRQVDDALRSTLGERTWWIIAEIRERNDRGDYIYLELAEKAEGNGDLVARIRASVWRREAIAAFRNFEDITGKRPDKGMQVLVRAGVSFHPTHGLSLQLFDIDSQHMLGQLELHRRQTIEKLSALPEIQVVDGRMMTPNKRLSLPDVIQNIAVITSASAAGYQDFTDSLKNNPFGYRYAVKSYYSIVQGEKAAESMREQLLNVYNDSQNGLVIDAVILIRGGGAQSDLLPFDQFRLAHALARFPIPVIAGIGHLKNESVADMVVHTSVKTPTQAAEFLIDHNRAYEEEIEALREMIILRSRNLMATLHRKVDHCAAKINSGALTLIHSRTRQLERTRESLVNVANERLAESASLLGEMRFRFSSVTEKTMTRNIHLLEKLENTFRLLDPMVVLKRGYAMVRKGDEVITSAGSLNKNDKIILRFADGTATADVNEVNTNQDG